MFRTRPTVRPLTAGSVALLLLAGGLLPGCATTTQQVSPAPAPGSPEAVAAEQNQQQRLAAASAASQAGNYEQALAMFRDLLAENALLTDAYMGIGDIHRAQGDFDQAEPAYARAARIAPRSFDAQYWHGVVLQTLDRFVEAIQAYHRALTIRPEDFDANANMASVYMQIEQPSSATIFAEKAVELRPDDGAARVNLGSAYASLGRMEEAITQYETAMELLEPTPELMLSLINAYAAEKRYQEAVNAATVLVRISPTANAYERLGWGYFRLGRFEDSIDAYREAVRVDAGHWPSLNGIGVNALNAWLLSDRRDNAARNEARDALQRSIRANPQQPKVVQLLTTYQL